MSAERKIELYKQLKQTLQTILLQKEAYSSEKMEAESAIAELEKYPGERVFKSIGPAMIEVSKEEVMKELKERIEEYDLRLKSLESQEKTVRSRLEKVRKEIEEMLEEKG